MDHCLPTVRTISPAATTSCSGAGPGAFEITNTGLRTSLHLLNRKQLNTAEWTVLMDYRETEDTEYEAVLNCRKSGFHDEILTLSLRDDADHADPSQTRHMTVARVRPRISPLRHDFFTNAWPHPVVISRDDVMVQEEAHFYLQGLTGLSVVNVYAMPPDRAQYNENSQSIMVSNKAEPVALGLDLETNDQKKYFVVFGYRFSAASALESRAKRRRLIPAIRCKRPVSDTLSFIHKNEPSLPCVLKCEHPWFPCGACTYGIRPWKPYKPTWAAEPGNRNQSVEDDKIEGLSGSIKHRELVGVTTFAVHVDLSRPNLLRRARRRLRRSNSSTDLDRSRGDAGSTSSSSPDDPLAPPSSRARYLNAR